MTPLYADRVFAALNGKESAFEQNEVQIAENLKRVKKMVRGYEALSEQDVLDRLQEIEPGARFGALPTVEQETQPFTIPFKQGRRWTHHRLARDWAAKVLDSVTTFAADGSVIEPGGDMSVPVGLIQVGWFQNKHTSDAEYVKDVQVTVVSPDELDVPDTIETEMAWLRFKGESERSIKFMRDHRGQRAVAFLDGTLTISFVRNMQPKRQKQYERLVKRVIKTSMETQVPAVGYVDTSHAIDLVTLVYALARSKKPTYDELRSLRVNDAGLLRAYRPPMRWGDRSRTYICNRDDAVIKNDYYRDICFTYLQTTGTNPPSRLEIPRWVFENTELYEWVLDVVRAECVVGVGYPYPLETADAVAVLTGQDRERFYHLFQGFAGDHGIAVQFSRKSISKRGRRI